MRKCELCGKVTVHGNRVSHSHRLTKRVWKPNLQKATILLNGEKTKVTICTKCLKSAERA